MQMKYLVHEKLWSLYGLILYWFFKGGFVGDGWKKKNYDALLQIFFCLHSKGASKNYSLSFLEATSCYFLYLPTYL